MIKKGTLFFYLLSIQIIVCAQSSSGYEIKGTIPSGIFDNKILYLKKLTSDRSNFITIDSATVNNRTFTFSEPIISDDVLLRFIVIPDKEGQKQKQIIFIAESGKIHISIEDKYRIGGTDKNIKLQNFFDLQDSLQQELSMVINKYDNMNQTSQNYMLRMEEIKPIAEKLNKETYKFAQSNIKNDIGESIALSSYRILSPEQMLELMAQTNVRFRDSNTGQSVINYFQNENIKNGKGEYKDITLKSPAGKDIALSDFVGKSKVVLIDFWASWCGPCIKEMPNIVKAYEKYKDKGLEIVGISLDENAESWTGAIKRLNITWPQMSDLGGWKSSAAVLYGIDTIPFALLVDKDGKVLASYLYGESLMNKLSELLD